MESQQLVMWEMGERPTRYRSDAREMERTYYTIYELSETLKTSPMSVRRMFQDRPGVLKLGPSGRRGKRDHVSLRIPQSVLEAVLDERSR
jgi:hypothetical protein